MHVTRVHEAQVPKRHYISLKRCFFCPKMAYANFVSQSHAHFFLFLFIYFYFYNVLYLFHLYHILSHICDEFNFYVSYILIRSDFCQYWFLKNRDHHYERSPTPKWHGIQQSSPPLSLYGSFLSRPPQKLQPYYPLNQLMRKLPPLIDRFNLLYLELIKLLLDFQGHFPLRNGMVCGFFFYTITTTASSILMFFLFPFVYCIR